MDNTPKLDHVSEIYVLLERKKFNNNDDDDDDEDDLLMRARINYKSLITTEKYTSGVGKTVFLIKKHEWKFSGNFYNHVPFFGFLVCKTQNIYF